MREQGKHRSLGNESVTQEHRKLKAIGHPSMPQEQGKGNAVTLGKKSLAKHLKGSGVIYSSDAERKLDGVKYRLGDMVWAKVKSHPWWPGQLYDPALASANAMELKRDSCFLVAFFGDSTFGWFAEAELIPYEPNFAQKSRQTSAPNFVDAVEDSLDEVRKRVKLALACRCSAAEDDSEIEEKKDGLLYDRQLYDIRGGFEPAKLLSAVKQLASSPFSFSQSMLKNTVARVQSDAFRRLVSHKTLLEHKEIEGLPQRQHMKEHEFNTLESLKIKKLSEKDISKKQPSKALSVSKSLGKQEASGRKRALEKALDGMNEMSKNKKRTKGVIFKNSHTGKSQECFGDKGVTNDTISEMNNIQSGEHDAADFNEDLTNKKFENERGFQEGGCVPDQLDACPGNALSDRGTPSLAEQDASVSGHDQDQITGKTFSNAVPDFENIKLAVIAEESNATIKKTKIAKVKKDQGLKPNVSKKVGIADTELKQTSKKLKGVSKAKDKRFVDNVPTDTCRDIKKRKVIPIGKRGDLPVYSAATDSLPTLETPQQADKITSSPAVPKITGNHMQAEPVAQLETEVITSAEIPGVVLEPGRLCQEDAQQHRHVDDDAVEALVTGPLTIMGKNESDGDRKAACSFQEGIASNAGGKYEENLKDSGLIEQIDLLMFQEESVSEASKKREKIEDFSICDSKMKGQMEGEILETQLQAIENQTSKDSNVSPSRADCTMPNFDDSCAVQAFECGTAEKMQGGFQINAKVSASKHGQENKRPPRDNRERKQSLLSKTMLSSKKRGTEENISKGLQAKNKRIKSVASEKKAILHRDVGGEDGEKHLGLCRGDVEGAHVRSLHEELMFVAAKRLDVNEECSSGVNRASTNFRKVIHKKAVFRADPDNSVSALSGAVSEEVSEVGNANNEVAMLLTEKIENKVIISADPTGAEPSEVEDIRIQGAGGDSVSLKESEEGSIFPQAMPTKRSRTVIIPLSSSSVSLRPAFEAVTPVHGPKEVLNRFGQRVPHAVETGEMRTSLLSRVKSQSEKRDLVISFPSGYILPSAKELMEVFMKFGELNAPLTQVDSKHGCAHIVFRHSRDAETALNSMKVNPVFENAHFWLKPWLKPREVNMKGTTKLASRNAAMSENPILSSSRSLAESKIVADMRSRTSADKDSYVHSSNNVSSLGVADKTTVSENTRCGSSESALQSSYRDALNPFLPVSTASLQMSPIQSSGGKQGKLNEIHPVLVASPSVILKAGARSLASPSAADISKPFLALLHQLHDLVLSTGFVM